MKKELPDIAGGMKWFLAIPLCFLLVYGMREYNWEVVLSNYQACDNIWTFYLVSFAGIYVSLYVAKLINKVKYLRSYFIFIGKHSFEIMAWHLLVVKLVDVCYARMIGETNVQIYGAFTNAYASTLWPVYLILGTLIPAACADFVHKARAQKYLAVN